MPFDMPNTVATVAVVSGDKMQKHSEHRFLHPLTYLCEFPNDSGIFSVFDSVRRCGKTSP